MTRSADNRLFYRYRRTILLLARVTGVLPKPLLRALYGLFQPCGGLFFVLLRFLLVKNLAAAVGDNVFIDNHVAIRFFENLSLGSNVSINRNCYIGAMGGIRIGSDVSIAHQTSLVSFEHGWKNPELPIRRNPLELAPIIVAEDVWIGAGARILSGAKIESRCIVAAGSVVTRKTEARYGHLIAGVPAAPKKALADRRPVDDLSVRDELTGERSEPHRAA